MADTTWSTVSKKVKPNKPKPRKPSPPTQHVLHKVDDISKLFPADESSFAGAITGRSLADVRKLIYSYAWSRERRDESKRDFVVSEFGTDRNVMHYTHYFDQQGELRRTPHFLNRCNLMFANKQISAEFLQHVYSVNSLEIDVDLKKQDTPAARAALDSIVARLHSNPYFQKFTRFIRVRIHFPDKYTYHGLPAINKAALEKIAAFIDGCKNMAQLDISIVMMNGPDDYELEYATFPFYPLKFVHWQVQVLNLRTCRFEPLRNEELGYLDNAWSGQHNSLAGHTTPNGPQKLRVASTPGSQSQTAAKAAAFDARKTSNDNGSKLEKNTQGARELAPAATLPHSDASSTEPLHNSDSHKKSNSVDKGSSNGKSAQGIVESAKAGTPPPSVGPVPSVTGDNVTVRLMEPPSPPFTPAATLTLAQTPCGDHKLTGSLSEGEKSVVSKPPEDDCKEDLKEVTSTNNPQTPKRTPVKDQTPPQSGANGLDDLPILPESTPSSSIPASSSSTLNQSPSPDHESQATDSSRLESAPTVMNKDDDNVSARHSVEKSKAEKEKDKKAKERKRQRQRVKRRKQQEAVAKAEEIKSEAELMEFPLHAVFIRNETTDPTLPAGYVISTDATGRAVVVRQLEERRRGQATVLTVEEWEDTHTPADESPLQIGRITECDSDDDKPEFRIRQADNDSDKKTSTQEKEPSNKENQPFVKEEPFSKDEPLAMEEPFDEEETSDPESSDTSNEESEGFY